jgi:hypothetical protein
MAGSAALAANAIPDWKQITESIVAGSGRKSAVAVPYYAYVDVAMYDAVSAIDRRYQPFAVRVHASRDASQDAAAATAAHDVLVHYFPANMVALDADLATSLGAIPDGAGKTEGVDVGHTVASEWLALRAGDGLEAPLTYTWGHGPGIWEPVATVPVNPPTTPAPVGVWLRAFKPFALRSTDQFLDEIPPPPALSSEKWAKDYNRTKDYGSLTSTVRTAQETEIGRFWTDDAAAQYSRAMRGLMSSEGLDTAHSARLAAMGSVALSDSIAACFNAKYHFGFWRPYTAIHDSDPSINPETIPDPNWIPLAATPGHPEYPAAHGCATQGLMDALTEYFGTDEVPFVVTSAVTGTTHTFTSFEDVVREVDNARIYGGMHYHNSVKEGNRLANKVVEYILKHHFHGSDE